MNKKISLENIISGARKTAQRFPFVLLVSIATTVVSLLLIHNQEPAFLSKLFFTLTLAFPLFIAATIFTEQKDSKRARMATFSLVGIFLLIYLAFLSKDFFNTQQIYYYTQYILWLAGAFTLVTFTPFIKKTSENSLNFWYYNQRIFYSFLATFIYSATIYIGLSIALLSVNYLFDLNVDSIRWSELWIVIVGMFSTTFFLSRYPQVQTSEEESVYPKELKIFTYYVLTPLVCIYFLILYSYTAKIILTWVWPKGIVSSMVLGFSALGIFTYLLVYPLILKENSLSRISKIFFGILLPQVAMLFWAIWLRVSDYGITEKRYLLIVFGFWLLVISLYFLVSKARNIRLIVMSLFVVFVGISFGPWGIFSVSESSQIHRLKNILQKTGILVGSQVIKVSEETVSFEDKKEISEILSYLDENHGFEAIQPLFNQDLNALTHPNCEYGYYRGCTNPSPITQLMGFDYIPEYRLEPTPVSFTTNQNLYYKNLKVSGYDYVINDSNNAIELDGNTYIFRLDSKTSEYFVFKNGSVISTFPLKAFFDQLSEKYKLTGKSQFSDEEMTTSFEDSKIKMKIYFSSITITKSGTYAEETILATFK